MNYSINTSIVIHSAPENVWGVLTNFEHYSKWNPFIQSIQGEMMEGEKINVQIGKMNFRPVIKSFIPNQKFQWLGHLFIRGLFDGEHSFVLEKNPDGTTTFIHGEKFKGILVRFFKKKLETSIRSGFEAMNKELKERVESD